MTTDTEVVRSYIDGISRGDMDAIGEALADDVVFHLPGRNPTSGEKHGRDEALGMFRTLLDRAGGSMKVDIHDLLSSDDHVVALVSRVIAGVDTQAAIVYHMREGKITEVWSHEGDQYAIDEAMKG